MRDIELHLHDPWLLAAMPLVVVILRVAQLSEIWLKVGVVAGLLRRDASSRVVNEHHFEKFESVFVKVMAKGLVIVTLPFRE